MTWFHIFAIVWTPLALAALGWLAYAIRSLRVDASTRRRREVSSRPHTTVLDPDRDPKGNP